MDDQRDGQGIRREGAALYARWVSDRMKSKNWDQATLARRAGLTKQTIGQIIAGASLQPTAWQVARIAHAFRVDPNEVFDAMGLWENPTRDTVLPGEMVHIYHSLDQPTRRTFLRIGEVLQEHQKSYTAHPEPGSVASDDEPKPPATEGELQRGIREGRLAAAPKDATLEEDEWTPDP